ncbi:MAG: enoyl-CoA hydratase/carnithine racemase [Myxococcota bacterium]
MTVFRGEALTFRRVGPAVEVTLHREPLNELGTTALAELEVLAEHVRSGAGGARALILHSDRRGGFCAGADLRELHAGLIERRAAMARRLGPASGIAARALRPVVRREVRRFIDRIHAVFDTLDTAPLTTIAVVHGVCFGGGFELALTADILIAEKSARFAFPELRLGLVPGFGGIPRLNRDVGNGVVRDLLLTGRSINATRAHAVGLASQRVGRGQGLDAARRVAEQAARFDSTTTAEAKAFAKRLPRAELDHEKDTFCRLVTRPEVLAALTRFVESTDVRPYLP